LAGEQRAIGEEFERFQLFANKPRFPFARSFMLPLVHLEHFANQFFIF
jgi:hypothetical protein